jgi:hypothetical protein
MQRAKDFETKAYNLDIHLDEFNQNLGQITVFILPFVLPCPLVIE